MHIAFATLISDIIQYRWMYPFQRFMGDSKRSVKNKAKVEGSIYALDLHQELSHFGSHYFNHMMLTPRIIRNEVNVTSLSWTEIFQSFFIIWNMFFCLVFLFYFMEHLLVHLVYDVLLDGIFQYRWMYL